MQDTARPIVAVSKCLEFEACRWNGGKARADLVRRLMPHVSFKPVCVEAEIGLGVPRKPTRLVMVRGLPRLLQPATGKDVTDSAVRFTRNFLDSLPEVDGFIFKSGSPTCGLKNIKVHADPEKDLIVRKAHGLFAAEVMDRFPHLPVEDDAHLINSRQREHFLTRLFTIARFRALRKAPSLGGLVKFHTHNELLLTAYHHQEMQSLERAIARRDQLPAMEIMLNYEEGLYRALAKPPPTSSLVNAFMYAFGCFKEELAPAEKQSFLDLLEKYRRGQAPIWALRIMLREWADRHGVYYLKRQTILHPYPRDLAAEA
ncbi:MAG TPA: DUF523 and DUF1722 domain-containing protein [bacterium]|nr:DUF523 and DUF1722 domain-containing protein [bacterium]